MAITAYIQLNFQGTITYPGQATGFQLVAPWGASQYCESFEEAVCQIFEKAGNRYAGGRIGNYFLAGTTNGLSSTITGTATANDIGGSP